MRTFYAGHRRDDESGMFYMKARWYDPGAGRFMSVDPLVRDATNPQSMNPYSYTENNPVNGIDPTGQAGIDTVWTKHDRGPGTPQDGEHTAEPVGGSSGVNGDVTRSEFTIGAGDLNVPSGLDGAGTVGGSGAGGIPVAGVSGGIGGVSLSGQGAASSLSGLGAARGGSRVADDDPNITPAQQMENFFADSIDTLDSRLESLNAENGDLEKKIKVYRQGIDDAQHALDNPVDGNLERTLIALLSKSRPIFNYGGALGHIGRIEANRGRIQRARRQIAGNDALIGKLSSSRERYVNRRQDFREYFSR